MEKSNKLKNDTVPDFKTNDAGMHDFMGTHLKAAFGPCLDGAAGGLSNS